MINSSLSKTFARKLKQQQGTIQVSADNTVSKVEVNGRAIPLPAGATNWEVTKTIKTGLFSGDKISITANNVGGWSASNPAGIIATINFTDDGGRPRTINTGAGWTCNGKNPQLLGNNSQITIWRNVKGGFMANIAGAAQWIWDPSHPITATCSIVLPRKVTGIIYTTVDNYLTSVKVNGVALAIPAGGNDWTVTKTIKTPVNPGDTISITGSNAGAVSAGNPAGIIATIVYPDDNGVLKTVNTGTGWNCNSRAPKLQGTNNQITIWRNVKGSFLAAIAGPAQWIWDPSNAISATCSITLPGGVYKIRGLIKNATNNEPITSNEISIVFVSGDRRYTATILPGGIYEVTLPKGTYTREVTLSGFATMSHEVVFTGASNEDNRANQILLSPVFQGWRAVLTWAATPKDLDAQLHMPNGNMINYQNKQSDDQKVTLDVDDRDGFGPETLTMRDISEGVYRVLVNNYSKDAPFSVSQAEVSIYNGDRHVAVVKIPTTGAEGQYWWHVANIDAATNNLEIVNEIRDTN